MDAEEREEVVTQFSSWMVTEGYHAEFEELDEADEAWWEAYGEKVGDYDTTDSAFYANFGNFCEWFKTIAENIERYRAYTKEIEDEKRVVEKAIEDKEAEVLKAAVAERALKAKLRAANPFSASMHTLTSTKSTTGSPPPQPLSAVPSRNTAGSPAVKTTYFGYVSSSDSEGEGNEQSAVDSSSTPKAGTKTRSVRFADAKHPAALSTDSLDFSRNGSDGGFDAPSSRSLTPPPATTGKHKESFQMMQPRPTSDTDVKE